MTRMPPSRCPQWLHAPTEGRREVLCDQLAEMARREADTAHAHPHSADLSPRTPRRTSTASSGRLPGKMAPLAALPPHPPPAAAEEVSFPYTSLLMTVSGNCTDLIGSIDRMGDTINNCSVTVVCPQFHSPGAGFKAIEFIQACVF